MDKTIAVLRHQNKIHLAETLEKFRTKSVHDYSQELMSHQPEGPIEAFLIDSFREEMEERGFCNEVISKTLKELEQNRIIQTMPHTSVVPSNRMLCIDWLSTRTLTNDRPYIVGSFSGVPFSNSVRPSKITLGEKTINCAPSQHQDSLVYYAPIFEKTKEQYKETLSRIPEIPNPAEFSIFSDWACQTSQNLHEKVLGVEIVYLDINKIITRYLLKIIDEPHHPLYKILFEEKERNTFIETFGDTIHLFYGHYTSSKNHIKQELLFMNGYDMIGNHQQFKLTPEVLREKLKQRELCPATIITFTVLTFLNDSKCLGSFIQIEYLTDFKEKWQKTDILNKDVSQAKTKNLSTGQFPDFSGTALDFLNSHHILPNPTTTRMEDLWEPMKDIFIH